jgi:hypothetical protein
MRSRGRERRARALQGEVDRAVECGGIQDRLAPPMEPEGDTEAAAAAEHEPSDIDCEGETAARSAIEGRTDPEEVAHEPDHVTRERMRRYEHRRLDVPTRNQAELERQVKTKPGTAT